MGARTMIAEGQGGRQGAQSTPLGLWNTVFDAQALGSMVAKYAWLRRAVLEAEDPVSPDTLREAARRWPGSLRECQRVSPERYREREQWALEGLRTPECAYAAWEARGRAAICLWSELHQRTAETLAWRSKARSKARGDEPQGPEAFLRDLTLHDPGRRSAWPEERVVMSLGIAGVGAGLAEACLAIRAGWDRSRLRACLLALPAG